MLAAAKSSNPDPLGSLFHALALLWPLWLLIAGIGAVKLAWRLYQLRRLSRSGITEVDQMDGTTFEIFLTTLFRRLGYAVEHTGRHGDYGADLVVTKDGRRIAVQAKRWSKAVGVKAVQEAVASKGIYKCAEALVVANRAFTRQARTLAEANDVTLWDRDVLVTKLPAVGNAVADGTAGSSNGTDTPAPRSHLSATATLTDTVREETIDTRHCARCGVAVPDKVRDYCLARPERFDRRVFCFKHQRRASPAAETS